MHIANSMTSLYVSFVMKREEYKHLPKGYYHLSTDGRWEGLIFHTNALFAYGMTLIGLLTLLFPVEIYAFTLMNNHIHIVLSGTGRACRDTFHYLVRKLNIRLRLSGYPELPDQYGFKLVTITSLEQLKNNIIYLDRNPYEKQYCVPAGYPWGSTIIHYNRIASILEWTRADTLSKRELERLTGSRIAIPGDWEFNPVLGLNPACFVRNDKFLDLFPTAKSYQSRLTKDYEAFVKVAENLDESMEFSQEELEGIMNEQLRKHYSGRSLGQLKNDEKGYLAVLLAQNYHLPSNQIAGMLGLQEYLVKQFLNAKDYGTTKFGRR